MLSKIWLAPLALAFVALPLLSAAQDKAPKKAAPPALDAAGLAFMSGHWETAPGGQQTDENWTDVAGGTLFGTSRTVAGGKTVFFEFLRVETRKDGVFYVAQPKGGKGTDFQLVKLEGEKATFENLAHDFPKRILYWKDGKDLVARIEGDGSEPEKAQEFRFAPRKGR
jgi:hypothetical protein